MFRPSQLLRYFVCHLLQSVMMVFYSYPGCCVLQYPPILYKCKDAAAICTAFMNCLHFRLPTLCSYSLNYTTRLLQPNVGLTTALHCRETFVNLLPVDRKPVSVRACKVTDYSSTVIDSDNIVKPPTNDPYKPIFHSVKVSNDRRLTVTSHLTLSQQHSNTSSGSSTQKLLPIIPYTGKSKLFTIASNNNQTIADQSSRVSNDSHNDIQRVPAITAFGFPTTSSSLHKVCTMKYYTL